MDHNGSEKQLDDHLGSRLRAGDEGALLEVTRLYDRHLFNWCRRNGLSPGEADEVVWQVFNELWKAAQQALPGFSPRVFLWGRVKRRIIDKRRRRTTMQKRKVQCCVESTACSHPLPHEALIQEEERLQVDIAIASLSDRHRIALEWALAERPWKGLVDARGHTEKYWRTAASEARRLLSRAVTAEAPVVETKGGANAIAKRTSA